MAPRNSRDVMPARITVHSINDISRGKFIGYKHHAEGIRNALHALCMEHGVAMEHQEWDASKLQELKNFLQQAPEKSIVICPGEPGLAILPKLKHDPEIAEKCFAVWSGHQWFMGMERFVNVVDVVALPGYALDTKQRELLQKATAQFVETIGVPHHLTQENVRRAYAGWNEKIPGAVCYVGMFLGGDAPEADGITQRYFMPEEAALVAEYAINKTHEMEAALLILTNPRTGKFDPRTGKERTTHLSTTELDPTSQAFLSAVQASGVPYYFSDFRLGVATAFQPVLGALLAHPGSAALVTGDSTSMVSEVCDILPPGSVTIVNIHSMNATHHRHAASYYDTARAHVAEVNIEEVKITERKLKKNLPTLPASAAEAIAALTLEAFTKLH